jgi:dephospho-CoA kinase
MIIGITGTYCAGKDAAASILEKKNFIHISISDILNQYCVSQGKEATRENLTEIGNSLRKEYGAGILGKLALDGMQQGKNYVVTSIRNPSEVLELKKANDFYLIKLDAPLDLRYARFEKRRDLIKDKNITTKQEFIKREESEKSNDAKGLQLHKVFELADATILNDKDEKHLEKQLDEFVKNHSK